MNVTDQEKVIFSAYTGIYISSNISAIHEYIESKIKRTLFSHELIDTEVQKEIREKVSSDYNKIDVTERKKVERALYE